MHACAGFVGPSIPGAEPRTDFFELSVMDDSTCTHGYRESDREAGRVHLSPREQGDSADLPHVSRPLRPLHDRYVTATQIVGPDK